MSTKKRILSSALKVFGDKGYTRATTKDIAKEAGIHESTLFRHFEQKQKILLDALIEFSLNKSDTPISYCEDIEKDLYMLGKTYIEQALNNVSLVRISLMESPVNPEVAKIIYEYINVREQRLVEYFQMMHEKGKIPGQNFLILASMFYGVLYSYVSSKVKFEEIGANYIEQEELLKETVILFTKYLKISG